MRTPVVKTFFPIFIRLLMQKRDFYQKYQLNYYESRVCSLNRISWDMFIKFKLQFIVTLQKQLSGPNLLTNELMPLQQSICVCGKYSKCEMRASHQYCRIFDLFEELCCITYVFIDVFVRNETHLFMMRIPSI